MTYLQSLADAAVSQFKKHSTVIASAQSPSTNESKFSVTPNTRVGHRPNLTANNDLTIAREVATAQARVAPNGATRERFDVAANRANATLKLSYNVT